MKFARCIGGATVLFLLLIAGVVDAQITQTIRGTVVDKNTGVPLIGASIVLLDHEPLIGTITDHQGYFHLREVPVGKFRKGIYP